MFEIVRSYEHFTVLLNGEFYCSADNLQEAEQEVLEYERQVDDDIKKRISTQTGMAFTI